MILPPYLLIHADWSKNENKRWMVKATRQPDSWYAATAPEKAGDLSDFIKRHVPAVTAPGAVWFGFDFPIGLPKAYADRVNITNFMSALPLFGVGDWSEFYCVAHNQAEINLRRPFYPNRQGGRSRNQLVRGLDLKDWEMLFRACEFKAGKRPAACPLFWTLGPKQVGKAAIVGWSKVLAPALKNQSSLRPRLKLWPFEGPLDELSQPGQIVIVETYPAEYYYPLSINFKGKSKGNQAARQEKAEKLLEAAARVQVRLDDELARQVVLGFDRQHGEDDGFDALVGLLGMVDVARNYSTALEPLQEDIRHIEGWIFGMKPNKAADC